MIDFSIGKVAAAYASNRSAASSSTIPPVMQAPVEKPFDDFITEQITRAVETVRQSEQVSLAAISGKASTQEVVQSVIAAEVTIQAMVAVRDRMVQAYQDIVRMPI